jgi:acyl-[acyl-carrier-protein]-phospholipid O-acyltransferase/long-chain-fatty-acid--[acyl-carrier-protein] ligase
VTQPDPRRGERLVLVTEHKGAARAAFQAYARTKGASDLMVPADVIIVDKLPLLGSGKPDFPAAARHVAARETAAAE